MHARKVGDERAETYLRLRAEAELRRAGAELLDQMPKRTRTLRRLPPSGTDLQPSQGGPALSGLKLTQRGQARRRRLAGLPHEETG